MSTSWNDMADGWDSNEAVRTYSEKAFASINEVVSLEGKTVLDVGCGTGLLTEKLSPLVQSITAVDPAERMVAVLENKALANVHAVVGLVDDAFVARSTEQGHRYDLIVASSALAFAPNLTETLTCLAALLTEDGQIVQWDWLKQAEEGAGFTESELQQAYRDAGLRLTSTRIPFEMGDMPVLMAVGALA